MTYQQFLVMGLDAVTIVLPEKAMEALKRRAESEGKALEEIVNEAVFDQLNIIDPEARAELYLKLCEKYMREAEDLLTKKDYVQASEKAWGAASQSVKALAAKEGKELRGHASLWEYMDRVAGELGDLELRRLWRTANILHQNFYENWMPPREVELSIKDVKSFIEKLRETTLT